jgi:hypothetical protein
MVEVGGVLKDMLAVTAGDVFKAIQLPPNAEIVGGEVQVEVQGVGPRPTRWKSARLRTARQRTSPTRFGATSLLTAIGTRTALTLTARRSTPASVREPERHLHPPDPLRRRRVGWVSSWCA